MGRRYFGTDGVRGRVGEHPMTVDFALKLASSAARVLAPQGGTVLIGKDTRLSGYMFESALEAGFVAAGVHAMLIGPLPTPGIAYMTRRFNCDFGVVISASHNLYDDNGIKFFDASGGKLSDSLEERIETEVAHHRPHHRAAQRPGVLQRAGDDVEQLVTIDDPSQVIDHHQAIAIAIERESDVGAHARHRELQQVRRRRAAAIVDVAAVR